MNPKAKPAMTKAAAMMYTGSSGRRKRIMPTNTTSAAPATPAPSAAKAVAERPATSFSWYSPMSF